jgi:glycosyltransferase involved in cell wall biosynthesis
VANAILAVSDKAMYDCKASRLGSNVGGMVVRIALLVDSPSRRAHGNAASRLALGLIGTGRVEVTLLCYSADPAPKWLPSEVRIHRLGVDRASRSLPSLVRYLRAQKPDVLISRQVHANFVALAAALVARVPPPWLGKLVVVQDHVVELTHASNWRDNKWLAKVGYRFADGLIAPSPTVLEHTIRWCGLNPSSAALVPNPIPEFSGTLAPSPHPWLRDGEPPVFVNVSNMLPFKRVDLLIDAFADLLDRHEARLLILGDGPGRVPAAEQIQRLGLSAHAETVGWIDDPLQFAARAWALVHPSDEDGFAQVLTEAMSVGCPVIATDAKGGGPRFVTDNGRHGLLVTRGDREELAEAMGRMLQADVRARYAALGQKRIGALTPRVCADALLDFLAGLGVDLRASSSSVAMHRKEGS